jgi:hypothetical protein
MKGLLTGSNSFLSASGFCSISARPSLYKSAAPARATRFQQYVELIDPVIAKRRHCGHRSSMNILLQA